MKTLLKTKKGFAVALGLSAVLLTGSFSACRKNKTEDFTADIITRENYTSEYSQIGKGLTIDKVVEKVDGRAYTTVDGKEYELGMDFLSMAMVYNTTPVGELDTPTKVYNEWWRLFMQRWNWLVPEAPLYSNQYYDIYNAKINELKTNPYWSVTNAIVGARVKGESSVILGSNTELSGMFRNSGFGKSAPGAADLAIETLTTGYSTVNADMGGVYRWAGEEILRRHTETENADGTKTFTVEIAKDLTFSNGAPIKAENYLIGVRVGSSKVM